MRDTGPVNKELTGDQDASVGTIGLARTHLGIAKNLMRLGGLTQGYRTVTQPDGTVIRVSSVNGVDSIHIDSPVAVESEEEFEEPVVEEPELPEPPPPDVAPPVGFLAINNGYLPAFPTFDALFRPNQINGVTNTAPDLKSHYLHADPSKVTWKPLPSATDDGLGHNTLLFGMVDGPGENAAPLDLSHQPDDISVSSRGKKLPISRGNNFDTAKSVASGGFKTKLANMGELTLPNAFVDSPALILATRDGAQVAEGGLTVLKTMEMYCSMSDGTQRARVTPGGTWSASFTGFTSGCSIVWGPIAITDFMQVQNAGATDTDSTFSQSSGVYPWSLVGGNSNIASASLNNISGIPPFVDTMSGSVTVTDSYGNEFSFTVIVSFSVS